MFECAIIVLLHCATALLDAYAVMHAYFLLMSYHASKTTFLPSITPSLHHRPKIRTVAVQNIGSGTREAIASTVQNIGSGTREAIASTDCRT